MIIDFYGSFAKKENSTKTPPANSVTGSLTGFLIEPCSIMNPVVRIERLSSGATPQSYTYAYIGDFSRWYFVTDWEWSDGLWLCRMQEDILASFKTQIGNQTEYVLRTDSATTDFNGAIMDTVYPATTDFDIDQVAFQNPFASSLGDGTYIVGIISKNSAYAVGAISYYAMSSSEFGNLKALLLSDDNLKVMQIIDAQGNPQVDDISKEVLKTMYNPYQYIVSCMWFPIFKADITGTPVTTIDVGWWSYSNLSAKLISMQTGLFADNPQLVPNHPQASTRGKYLNYAPYTKLTMYGKFGSLPIDPAYLEIGSYISGTYLVDYVTGECIYQVYVSDNAQGYSRKEIARTSFLLGTPIQIAQVGVDYLGSAVSAVNATANAVGSLAKLDIGGAISSTANGIYNTLNASMPQLMTSGSNGSLVNAELSTFIIVLHFVIADEDIHHRGRPLCELRQLGNLSGFVLCAEGEIDLNCFDNERKAIMEYLTTGFFME